MRVLLTLILISLLIFQSPADSFSFFQKKDYKQIILNNASNAEKRKDYKSAFHSYEKAIYYYKKDVKVLEAYAAFCERRNYYDKAQDLYSKLYILTKDPKYLNKVNILAVKNGKLSNQEIKKILSNKSLATSQKKELSKALIFHYAYKKDWAKVKQTCDRLAIRDIGLDFVKNCIVASENTSDTKGVLKYSIRNAALSPKDSDVINKIISLAESLKDYKTEATFVKKLSDLNPDNNGIKYKLAGVYEKQKNWAKAAGVYKELMLAGDKSKHVTDSYNYVQSELHPKKQPLAKFVPHIYIPKPLSPFKIAEKEFYQAWKEKDYANAQIYLSKMLAEQPNNKKLLKHRVDIDVSQENYADAITYFERINTNSVEDTKFLAFLYSKTDDNKKALEIIENALQASPNNKELLALALQYSMAEKNWDSSIIYSKKLLAFMPNSEKLLKTIGDLYSTKEDFANALVYYEKLVRLYPTLDYQIQLANLYMANKEFESAESLLAPLYEQYPNDKTVIVAYLNSLSAQQKLLESYCVVKDKNLFDTKEGYTILGDLDMKYKHYDSAANNYSKALQFEPESLALQNKLADSYRLFGCIEGAEKIYCNILRKDPQYIGARMGLGSIEIKRKHFNDARRIFCCILREKPDYKPAKVGIAYSYIANGDRFSALDTLNQVEPDDETRLLKANIYYDLGMPTDARRTISPSNTWDAKDLKYKIRRDNAITITPTYSFLKQTLGENFRLNYNMGGVRVAQNIDRNTNVFMNYNVYVYTSEDSEGLTNVTNEFRGGVHGHPTPRMEYHTDVGVKVFEFDNGSMIVTDDWVRYHVTDNLALRLGFYRDNLIQTYTSAVGRPIDGIFTGRVADTRTYLEYDMKFPHDYYSFGRACYGVMYAQNLPTNQYLEGMFGVGKLLYNNPKNPIIQKVNFDLVSFNWTFQYNLLNLFNSAGVLFGGYFSPNFFSSNTANLKLQGEIKKLRLKYGCTGFAGVQYSNAPVFTELAWGVGPFLSYRLNDHVDINASYQYFDWAFMKRHIFMVSAVFRGFRRNGQS